MAEKSLGYEQTLLYGNYTKELSSFAKFYASRDAPISDTGQFQKPRKHQKVLDYLQRCADIRDTVFLKVGEDWIFLTILGVLMAILSFAMDWIIEKCQEAKFWLYEELSFSVGLQYFAWISYSLLFILFAVGFTHLVSPQAIGSGIPEMKTILRGVVLKEYLTFRTLIAKIVGLCSSLGSTLPFGKEGPFVHIASIVATLLSKAIKSFRGIYENESRRTEMLAAACAVGVAGTFAAPIGGVLFSIEVTATYFAVRNYWRGFFSAVCGALMFRLMAFWFKDEETLTALFKTNLRTEFPFDALELFAFAATGVACGFLGSLFILTHRQVILFTRRRRRLSKFLQKNRFIYPSIITLVISSLTFPPGLGQFFAGHLTGKVAINELFSNITWTLGQAEDLDDEAVLEHWKHPLTNIYVTLVLFIVMNFLMAVFSNTLPIPAGVFVPVFTIGAAFGRLVGESMAAWFPEGIPSGDIVRKIVPGGYAVVGAASLSGSVTRTISTAVIVFEVTGQISHVLPAVISVLIANAVANMLQPSFYDSIIKLKRLPYLPDIVSAKSNAWLLYVEDFMVKDVHFIPFSASYSQLQELLVNTKYRSYPLVDSQDSMILLGSIQRLELERILLVHISHDNQVLWSTTHRVTPPTARSLKVASVIQEEEAAATPLPPANNSNNNTGSNGVKPAGDGAGVGGAGAKESEGGQALRFRVTKVSESDGGDETGASGEAQQKKNSVAMKYLMVPSPSRTPSNQQGDEIGVEHDPSYNTIHVPLRSILKKSPSTSKLQRARSTGDLKAEVNNFYRKLAKQKKEGILEDVPYTFDRGSFSSLYKKVKLPPEPRPTKIKNLPTEDREAWEQRQLSMPIDWEGVQIDPAPFQLVERTSLHKVHSLFSLLGLNHAYVTNTGRLAGVVGLKELRTAVQGQIELQDNAKATSSSASSMSHVEEQGEMTEEEELEMAPFDKGTPEVDKTVETPTRFRLHSISNNEMDTEA